MGSMPVPSKATNPMESLKKGLRAAGFKNAYLNRVALPEWWDDEIATDSGGFAEGLGLIARNLGLDFKRLSKGEVCPKVFSGAKFKLVAGVKSADVKWATSLAFHAIEVAGLGCGQTDSQCSSSASDIRNEILSSGPKCVDLANLLDWCWNHGIPIIHISEFPIGKKMDGLAARTGQGFGIAVASNHKQDSWLLFILAHELGHICARHLENSAVIVDQDVGKTPVDDEEKEANSFAVELLTGRPGLQFSAPRWLSAEELAQVCRKLGSALNIDPGVIALNYAEHSSKKQFAAANGALNIIYPDADAPTLIRERMQERLSFSEIPPETCEWLLRLTGLAETVDCLSR